MSSHILKLKYNLVLAYLILSILRGPFLVSSQQPPPDGILKKEHSILKPYTFGTSIPNFKTSGNTVVNDQFIRLTNKKESQSGGLWNTNPLKAINWEIHLSFKIHGTSFPGDGMGFWYTNSRMAVGNMMGGPENFRGLGIIVDTFKNDRENPGDTDGFPKISGFLNDGKWAIHKEKDGKGQSFGSCSGERRKFMRNKQVRMKIRYYNKDLEVFYLEEMSNDWKFCFSAQDVDLPTWFFMGVSAATGELYDYHDVMSIKTYELPKGKTPVYKNELTGEAIPLMNVSPRINGETSGDEGEPFVKESNRTVFYMVIFVVLGCLGFFGHMKRKAQEELNRKRFY